MNHSPDSLDNLIPIYLSGAATPEQVDTLEQRLLSDPEARSLFLAHSRMDAALGGEHQADFERLDDSSKVSKFPRTNRPAGWFMVAAGFAVLMTISSMLVLRSNAGVKVEILASSGLAADTFPAGKTMRLLEAAIVQGTVKMRISSGAIIDLHGPAETRFTDPTRAVLKSGNITVDVAEASAKGFTLESPNLRVVDHGTKFGVSYRDNGETDIAVIDGEVSIFKQNEETKPLAFLKEGDAVRIDSGYVARRLAAVSLDGLSLAILEGNGKNESVVTDVSDSINEADFRRFYSIAPQAMAAGARPYSTLGKPRWQAMPEQEFPEELIGADVVATFSYDRFDADLSLTLSLAAPASIYLMVDNRTKVPSWITRDFQKTSLQLRAGPWSDRWADRVVQGSDDGAGYIVYDVWKRDVSDSRIVLGSPHFGRPTKETAMYGIAVKRQAPIQ